jgi:autotransporter translocation and assembly factor TamB
MAKKLAIGFGVLLAVPIVVLVLGLLALQFQPVRSAARDQLLGLIQGSLQGSLEVDDLRWPRLSRIELSGVRLKDRHGTLVANVAMLTARLRLMPLLSGQVQIEDVSVDGLYVDLGTPGTDRGLLSVFESREPPPPPEPWTGSPIPIRIERICLEGRALRVEPSPGERFALEHFATCARFAFDETLDVTLDRLRADVTHGDQLALAIVDDPALQLPAANREPARGWLRGRVQVAGDKIGFDGRVELRHLSAGTLAALGADGSVLTDAADLSLTARGDAQRMEYRVELRAPESLAVVEGEFLPNQRATARATSSGLSLARFTSIAIEPLTFALSATADLSNADGPRLQAELERGTYGAWALPKVSTRAEVASDGGVHVPSFVARYPGAHVQAQGRLAADGAIQAQVGIDVAELGKLPPARDALPSIRGKLAAQARFSRTAAGTLALTSDLKLSGLGADEPAFSADALELKVSVNGSEQRPNVEALLSGREAHVGNQRFADVQLSAHSAGDTYQVRGNLDGDRARLEAWIKPTPEALEAGGQLVAKLQRGRVTASVKQVRVVSGQAVEIEELRAEMLRATLKADGSVGLGKGESKLRVEARSADLSGLSQEFAGTKIPGQLELTADLEGTIERPKLKLAMDFRDGPRFAGGPSSLALRAVLDGPRGEAQLRANLGAGPAKVKAELDSSWRRTLPLTAAIAHMRHELSLELERASIGELVRSTDTVLPFPLAGSLQAQLQASGTLSELDVHTEIDAQVRVGDEPNLDVSLRGDYGGGGLAFKTLVKDRYGDLLKADWHQATRVESFVEKPPVMPEWLGQTAWEASVVMGSRRLGELPTMQTQKTARELWSLRSDLALHLAHAAGAEPSGELKVRADWDPYGVDAARATCSQKAKPSAEIVAKLREGVMTTQVDVSAADRKAIAIQAQLGSTLEEWLEGRVFQWTKAKIDGRVDNLDLAQWPVTCEQAAGMLTAEFSAQDLFNKQAKFAAKLGGRQIVAGKALPIDFDLKAFMEQDGMDVALMIERIGGHAAIRGSVPISFRVAEPPKTVNWDGPLALDVALTRVDVKTLLASAPGIARPSGTLDGRIKVTGKLGAPRGSGAIDLKDVSITLPELGQRFTKVNGRVAIEDNKVRIPELALRDQGGVAKFTAELLLDKLDAYRTVLTAKFDDFPVRNQGVLIGRADANAKVQLTAKPAQTDIEVHLSDVSINLSGDTAADVQSLDPHPEIAVAGEPAPGELEAEEAAERAKQPAKVVNVYIRSDDSLWVRRDDFAVRMKTDLTIHVPKDGPQISGDVKLERGYIVLLGQQFDLESGRVTFTGGQAVNPRLELSAKTTSPSGVEVRVEVTGFVSAPELAFFVDDRGATAGEAVSELMGGSKKQSGSEASAESQVASAALGMTTGLLSLGARRAFGDYIPMLSVQQDTDQTQVRAGFEVDAVVPKFMRSFVRGVYVEGVVSSGDPNAPEGESGGDPEGGVLLELMLPSDLVWAGQYGPGETWSVDLDWRP